MGGTKEVLKLSSRQQQVKSFIATFTTRHGYPPAYADIAEKVGCSIAAVTYQINQLEQKGHLTRVHGVARSLRIKGA